MSFDAMWLWWFPTVGLCAWKLIEGFARPVRMLEWPFLVCAMWLYFYGYMAYNAKVALSAYLGNDVSNIGQLMALLCLGGVFIGWKLGKRVGVAPAISMRRYPYGSLWCVSLVLIAIGAVGCYFVQRDASEGMMDFKHTSAYWYLLFYVGYPGLAMGVWAILKMESPARVVLALATLIMLGAFMYPQVLSARRGPLLPAVLILLLVPPLTLRRPPNRLLFVGGLACAALVMLLFLQVRVFTYNGGTWSDAVQNLDLGAAAERGTEAEDNEYVNSCQVIGTIFDNGKYQYGTGHLGLLVHWVPRILWHDKPVLGEGIYSFNELFDEVEAATGVRLLGSGASSGGVADTFVQYGVFCPLFWFAFSWGLARIYSQALNSGRPVWLFSYVAVCCASHWLISQSFSAAFVPCAYFLAIPILMFSVLDWWPQAQARVRTPAASEAGLVVERALP